MRLIISALLILSSYQEAIACGLRASSSDELLREISANYQAPATKNLPQLVVSGGGSLVVTNDKGEVVPVNDQLTLQPGMSISAKAYKAQIVLPSTGQVVDLNPGTTLQVVSVNRSADEKICSVSFEMQSGKASFSSNHTEREKNCKPIESDTFEVVTKNIAITPIGTKYNVDLNQAIAELNGEDYNEDVSVEKGSVKVRLVRLKKENKKSDRKVAAKEYAFEEQKAVIIKAGKKAKVKKGKKDRMADIQIVYPE